MAKANFKPTQNSSTGRFYVDNPPPVSQWLNQRVCNLSIFFAKGPGFFPKSARRTINPLFEPASPPFLPNNSLTQTKK